MSDKEPKDPNPHKPDQIPPGRPVRPLDEPIPIPGETPGPPAPPPDPEAGG